MRFPVKDPIMDLRQNTPHLHKNPPRDIDIKRGGFAATWQELFGSLTLFLFVRVQKSSAR